MNKISELRNVSIAPHIGTGKTTVTRGTLSLTGVTRTMGEVHNSHVTSDSMTKQGPSITIASTRRLPISSSSAWVSWIWKCS